MDLNCIFDVKTYVKSRRIVGLVIRNNIGHLIGGKFVFLVALENEIISPL